MTKLLSGAVDAHCNPTIQGPMREFALRQHLNNYQIPKNSETIEGINGNNIKNDTIIWSSFN